MSDTEPTSGNLFGTHVNFFPLATPYPSYAGCAEGIYRQLNDGTILAWDPVYTRFAPGANACYPPVQRSWWDQPGDADPSTALGPTFVCPEAYNAVHSTVLESNSASQAHYTYCCPKKYTLGAILPQDQRSVIQCSSIATSGVTLPYISVTYLPSTVTVTGDDGVETAQETSQLTQVPVAIIISDPATIYAPPINGYNILRGQATSSSSSSGGEGVASDTATTSTGAPSETGDASAQSGGLAAGAIAGIVVGVVLGLGLLLAGAFLVWRRRRRSQPIAVADANVQPEPEWHSQQPKGYYTGGGPPYMPVMSEMPVDSGAQEMEHSPSAYGAREMGHSPSTYELPSAR